MSPAPRYLLAFAVPLVVVLVVTPVAGRLARRLPFAAGLTAVG